MWVPIINTHGFGGRALDGTSSLTDCAKNCTLDPGCSAFDWDPFNPEGKRCWVIGSSSATAPSQGVYHYKKTCTPISTTGKTLLLVSPLSPPPIFNDSAMILRYKHRVPEIDKKRFMDRTRCTVLCQRFTMINAPTVITKINLFRLSSLTIIRKGSCDYQSLVLSKNRI